MPLESRHLEMGNSMNDDELDRRVRCSSAAADASLGANGTTSSAVL
jgi:hypothetical protein